MSTPNGALGIPHRREGPLGYGAVPSPVRSEASSTPGATPGWR